MLICVLVLTVLSIPGAMPSVAQQSVSGHSINPAILNEPWSAQWIAPPDTDGDAFGVYHFRRTVDLDAEPDSFVVHTSADNRYQLFVNGERVRKGPARGEIPNWRFETTDLAPYLESGSNVIAAVVWNFSEHRPVAQLSYQTGFVLQANRASQAAVNTGTEWKVTENDAYTPIPRDEQDIQGYLVVGPGERIDAGAYPWGWMAPGFEDDDWDQARELGPGMPKEGPAATGIYEAWKLVPRTIPRMEEHTEPFAEIDRAQGVDAVDGVLRGEEDLIVPAETEATLLLDQGELTTAYPVFQMSGGDDARIKITYAEALYDEDGLKGDRDEIEGKTIRGYHDVYLSDGGDERTYRPLWWRTFRYVQLDITTGGDPLHLHDVHSVFTAYPFRERASFSSDDSELERIWDVGWRTARVCANETYFDTPYWEQLQYVGDTRIQALISLYVDGDDRLMRKAIRAFDHSRASEGLTASRYPSHEKQFIPPYSLFWISMVHDYWMHRNDSEFVRSFLTPIRGVLDWYERRIDGSGLVGPVSWWNFVDWTFDTGVPPGADDGHSTIISLQLAYAFDHAADLTSAYDRTDEADHYRRRSAALKEAVREATWDEGRGLLADTPEKNEFSQHPNIFGVLTDLFSDERKSAVMERVLADTSLTSATYYFKFYLHRAMKEAGLGHRYVDALAPWREMLSWGLTTFAEEPIPTRSDSHAWSAHPNYHFLSLVTGITPAAPGFEKVRIAPSLGPLEWVEAEMPHPKGTIEVRLERTGEGGLDGTVKLPAELNGTFDWRGRTIELGGGTQQISL